MKFIVMSDLHLSKKLWQVRKALKMGEDADAVLLAGDLTNDGTPEQMELMHKCISEVLPDTPVFAVVGNHDYPHQPSPMTGRTSVILKHCRTGSLPVSLIPMCWMIVGHGRSVWVMWRSSVSTVSGTGGGLSLRTVPN